MGGGDGYGPDELIGEGPTVGQGVKVAEETGGGTAGKEGG